jgi:hypothetical protein
MCRNSFKTGHDGRRVDHLVVEKLIKHPQDPKEGDLLLLRDSSQFAIACQQCPASFRRQRVGLYLGGRFVADTILGATYLGAIRVWGGEDKRYTLLFGEDLSHATLAAASGGSTDAKCYPVKP